MPYWVVKKEPVLSDAQWDSLLVMQGAPSNFASRDHPSDGTEIVKLDGHATPTSFPIAGPFYTPAEVQAWMVAETGWG